MRKIIALALALVIALGIVGVVKASPASAATVPATTRYQQTDSKIAYVGTWPTFSTSGASAGSYRRSSQNEASATVRFNGTYLAWIATKGTTLGKAFVSLDGGPAVSVNLARSSVAYRQTVWSTGIVASGQHTVKIWRDPSSATGKYISVDAFDVAGSLTVASSTTTAASPITNLQSAINAAASGSTLTVPAGTYGPVQITKPLTLVGQSGAVISGGDIGVYIMSSNVTVQGFTVQGFGFTGIYCNGAFSNLAVKNVNVNGGGKAVFGLHFQSASGGYVDHVTITDSKFLGFTSSSSYSYPAHGVYLKVVHNVVMTNVDAGQTAGMGTHSGIDLDDVETGTLTNVVGHNAVAGIAVNRYPSTGCKNLTFRSSGGYSNTKADRFVYGASSNILWDSACYGTYQAAS